MKSGMKITTIGISFLLIGAMGLVQCKDGKEATGHDSHWTYEGQTGPEKWGELSEDFEACKLGKNQSPIDIKDASAADLPELKLQYKDAGFEVVNNGHTIQVNLKDAGKLVIGEDSYSLLQFHFHHPSEEAVNGERFPLVAHFVHKSDSGELAVIGLLFKEGAANESLSGVWSLMPAAADETNPGEGALNPTSVIKDASAYYTFKGSLTTPPCSEGVRWIVLKNPATISAEQVEAFKKLYPMNARPIQPLNDREIQVSN
ncbi:MAG: carbonic anhydrase family protein [Leptospiraceae bacterium]|nr:carbonic anhydrase family protein [Leptospiraceae bacterium]